ncbi:hypothetical protein EEB12_21080 [Rhodococcus sp. WS1]|nr:hypothetical protein EEB12_21080 [Rhodococcus sp. WS1]
MKPILRADRQVFKHSGPHTDLTVIQFVQGFDRRLTDFLRSLPKRDRYYSARDRTWEMDTYAWQQIVKPRIERNGWATVIEATIPTD